MIAFTFTIHPAAVLSANQRLHWAQRSRLTADMRARAAYAWRLQGQPQMGTAHCVAHLSYPDRRQRDADNLAPTIKALIDGLVHPHPTVRGLLPDDNDDHLSGPDKRPTGVVTPGWLTIQLVFTEGRQ